MMDNIVIENFLDDQSANQIEEALLSRPKKEIYSQGFPWYYLITEKDSVLGDKSIEHFCNKDSDIEISNCFVHPFYHNNEIKSEYFDILTPFKNAFRTKTNLKIINPLRIHSILYPKHTPTNKYNLPHIDYTFEHVAAIYYVNDNNGGTYIFNQQQEEKDFNTYRYNDVKKTIEFKIQSKKNTLLIFDGKKYHAGYLPSDNEKVIINFCFPK